MSKPGLLVAGGTGGTHARTEDLEFASRLLTTAAELLMGVSQHTRALRAQLPSPVSTWRSNDVAISCLLLHNTADEALAWVDAGEGGAGGVGREAARLATSLRQAVEAMETADHHARGFIETLGDWWDRGIELVELGWWLTREALGIGVARIGAALPDSGDGNRLAIAEWILPDNPPPLNVLVNRDTVATGLTVAALSHAPPWVTFGSDGARARWVTDFIASTSGGLRRVTSALDEVFGNPHGLWVGPVGVTTTLPPRGVAELTNRIARISPDLGGYGSRVTVERIENADGSHAWIVEIPGTQAVAPGGPNPFDWTANAQLLAGDESDSARAVLEAMHQADIPTGDPVMLTGHSQGGLIAMALVSSPAFVERYNVKSVVTIGSPVASFRPANDAKVLSIENAEDVVPGLDGLDNPDLPRWTTVTRDLEDSDDPADRLAARGAISSHRIDTYARTAMLVDESASSSVREWRDASAVFFPEGGATSTLLDFDAERGTRQSFVPGTRDTEAMVRARTAF